jgi:type VI secretion system protein VasG
LRGKLRAGGKPVDAPAAASASSLKGDAAGSSTPSSAALAEGSKGGGREEAEKSASSEKPANQAAQPPLSEQDRAKLLAELHELQVKLHALQGETPLIMPPVDAQAVSSVVSVGRHSGRPMVKNEVAAVLLAETLVSG